MKRFLPFLALAFGVLYFASGFRPAKNSTPFDTAGFARLPVLLNGRIKPMDTVARTTLLTLQERQRVEISEKESIYPTEWLLNVCFRPSLADTYQTFVVDDPDILAILGIPPSRERRLSYQELSPKLTELRRQAELAQAVEPNLRNRFQRAIVQLHSRLNLYQSLKFSLTSPESSNFLGDVQFLQDNLPAATEALRAKEAGQAHDEKLVQATVATFNRLTNMSSFGALFAVPGENASDPKSWTKVGTGLVEIFRGGALSPAALTYPALAHTWSNNDPEHFNGLLIRYRSVLEKSYAPTLKKTDAEVRFNAVEPFYKSSVLYVCAFFVAVLSWLKWPEALGRAAFYLVLVAWIGTTAGIGTRMWLEGRPPVTNLYSSALFVGWGAVGLCLILERIYKNAIGSAAAGVVGFCALLIAHHLGLGGDTMEMMRAVLDSNFWLGTHVVVISLGYASTFLAGFLAIIYIVRGVLTRSLDKATAEALQRMVYGIVCFATLFSFVGTILGGIWADQSWGRFWGWDPKENGALIIVIWNAVILHARWGGLIKGRGLMAMAVFGNVVTSWSWFGTNMLGVGLHSYGFMDSAFYALVVFVLSQLLIIAVSLLPVEKWRSFASPTPERPAAT